MPYDLNLNFTRTRIADPRVDVIRASKKTDAGGWDFTNGGTVGTLTEYASGVAAIHPTAGLLVEEGTTNEVRNPRCEGAAAGSPGTLPTNWLASGEGALTREIIGSGTSSGSPYVDVKYSGTATTNINIFPEAVTQIVAAQGEDWALSWGVQLVGGSLSNVSSIYLQFNERTAAGANLAADAQSSILASINSSHKRFHYARTLTEATTARLSGALVIVVAGAVDFTLRLFAPQIENKPYPTGPIFPTVGAPAASTRAADDVVVANGAWSNDDGAGTIFAEFAFTYDGQASTYPRVLGYGADASNRLDVYRDQAGEALYALLTDGGSAQASLTTSTAAAAASKSVAVAWDTNDVALSVSGGTQQTDASATVTLGSSALQIGAGAGGANGAAGIYIKDLRYFPRRLSNAEIEALVGN